MNSTKAKGASRVGHDRIPSGTNISQVPVAGHSRVRSLNQTGPIPSTNASRQKQALNTSGAGHSSTKNSSVVGPHQTAQYNSR